MKKSVLSTVVTIALLVIFIIVDARLLSQIVLVGIAVVAVGLFVLGIVLFINQIFALIFKEQSWIDKLDGRKRPF